MPIAPPAPAPARHLAPLPAALGVAALLGGCGGDPIGMYGTPSTPRVEDPVAQTIRCDPAFSSLGVPIADRPSYQERLALYAADRARAEPGKTGWDDFPPAPPLLWSDGLAQAGRAHSLDMRDTPCFQHTSCDGTDPFVRIKQYFTGGTTLGENIAAGVRDGFTVVEQSWINEVGAPPGETGHRENMFNRDFNLVGFGYLEGGKQYQGYWTQDLAGGPARQPPLAAGTHFPELPAPSAPATFGVVWYDGGGAGPDKVELYVDGKATTLGMVRGAEGLGAYEEQVALPTGCHRYRFVATHGSAVSCYPGSGTLGVAVSTTVCPAWQADK